jgi:hypothetical protein
MSKKTIIFQVFLLQLLPGFLMVGIFGDALHRADGDALRGIEVADALGAATGIDDIDLHALGDGLIGAFRLADIAIDALVGDHQGHGDNSSNFKAGYSGILA